MRYSIVKPSFWKSEREVRDDSNALAGTYRLANMWGTKAEGEARGRKLRFTYTGWDNRYSQMIDETGAVLAKMEPIGWWGMQYKLTYGGKEYSWRVNGWGTRFFIQDGTTEIVRVRVGGYFTPGSVEHTTLADKDVIPLVLYGLYQQYVITANAAAASGGASAVVVTTGT